MTIDGLRRAIAPLALAIALGGCAGPLGTSVAVPAPMPSYGGPGWPTEDGAAVTSAAIAEILDRPTDFAVPARVGVLDGRARGSVYGATPSRPDGASLGATSLSEDEARALLKEAEATLQATGRVKEVVEIPSALVSPTQADDALRQAAARFQCDVLVVVFGASGVTLVPDGAYSFWDRFWGDAMALTGTATVSAKALTTQHGRLLRLMEVSRATDPAVLKRDDATGVAELAKTAEKSAWRNVIAQLAEALGAAGGTAR